MSPKIVSPTPDHLHAAIEVLQSGKLVAIPTETVYGLAADATNDQAVARIFSLKQRPVFNPLIIHLATSSLADEYVIRDERAYKLAKAFWPGPLTVVLARKKDCAISLLASAGLDSLAIRVPQHPVALELLKKLKKPLAAPSANLSGQLSPSKAKHVWASFANQKELGLILDGGPCKGGIESTVVNLTEQSTTILRPGLVTKEEIERVIGPIDENNSENQTILSPGQMLKHYAPQIKLRLNATTVKEGEALLAFGPNIPQGFSKCLNLSPEGNLLEAATNFFAMLHELDHPQFSAIAVMEIPHIGIGIAINDRLQRAAF